VLVFVIARRKPQKLSDRGRGRVEVPDDPVGNTKAHGKDGWPIRMRRTIEYPSRFSSP
jgi:hypothetical protein